MTFASFTSFFVGELSSNSLLRLTCSGLTDTNLKYYSLLEDELDLTSNDQLAPCLQSLDLAYTL